MNEPTRCTCPCPGGYRCVCNVNVGHLLHICQHEACYCHSAERYAPESQTRPQREPVFVVEPLPYARTTAARRLIPEGRPGMEEV